MRTLSLTLLAVVSSIACGAEPAQQLPPGCRTGDAGCGVDARVTDGSTLDGGALDADPADTTTPPDAETLPALTADTFDVMFIERYCHKIVECCSPAESERVFGGITDLASCLSQWRGHADGRREWFGAMIARGTVRFDTSVAQACLREVDQLACPDYNRWFGPASCEAAYAPQLADGAPCMASEECASPGASCTAPDASGRRCTPGANVGEPCGPGAMCRPGTRCVGSSGFPPETPVCHAELELGAACQVGSQCASQTCGANNTCEPTPPLCAG